MSRLAPNAVLAAGFAAFLATPSAAVAGCASCYTAPPCTGCYHQRAVPPRYRTVYETVMVSSGSVVAHRIPPKYATVMVPRTVMIEPERVYHEHIPAQYASVPHLEMVAPAQAYVLPLQPLCGGCGYGVYGYRGGYGYGYGYGTAGYGW